MTLLTLWAHLGEGTSRSDVPAVAVALAAIVPTVAGLSTDSQRVTGAPIYPRFLLLSETVSMIMFTLWLLLRSATPASSAKRWVQDMPWPSEVFYRSGGVVCILLAAICGVGAAHRMHRAFSAQSEAMRQSSDSNVEEVER